MQDLEIFDYIESNYVIHDAQRLLLLSLIAVASHSIEYFKKWLTMIDFDAIDSGSFRLMPLVFSAFQTMQAENPYHARMKGIYRYVSFKHALLFAKGRMIFQQLTQEGIEFILFKGAALTLKYYHNKAVRMMDDMDFLIHDKDVLRAEEILFIHGLAYRYTKERRLAFHEHSLDYIDANENGYDMHRYALPESMYPGVDEGIWARSIAVDWNGLSVQVMSAEDLMLTCCVNGVRHLAELRYDWVYDVITIIRREPSIAWQVIYEEANARKLIQPLFNALTIIHDISPHTVPTQQLYTFLANHSAYATDLLCTLVSEGRSHGLNQALIQPMQASRKQTFLMRTIRYLGAVNRSLFPGQRNLHDQQISDEHKPHHIRCFYDEQQQINLLYLRHQYLSGLSNLFEICSSADVSRLTRRYPTMGEGYVKIKPGCLMIKSDSTLNHYQAKLTILNNPRHVVCAPGQRIPLQLKLLNQGSWLWISSRHAEHPYGVSYHVFYQDGTLHTWDCPRYYFLQARKNYVTFLGRQPILCDLQIEAPFEVGHYVIQLDVVHEGINWYSKQGNAFPAITLHVEERE